MKLYLITFGLLSATASATSVPSYESYYIHEKRIHTPSQWQKRSRLNENIVLPMRIGLTQTNLDRAEEYLLDISHPKSPNYGKHWTPKQVLEAFSPSKETASSVVNWLNVSGIELSRIKLAPAKNWIHFNATVGDIERLLNTTYYAFEHDLGMDHLACDEYSLPKSLREHVDFIMPTLQLDAHPSKNRKRVTTGSTSGPKFETLTTPVDLNDTESLSNCSQQITLACVRALYQIPRNTVAKPNNSIGIYEEAPNTYLPSDLKTFFSVYEPRLAGTEPTLQSADGGVNDYLSNSYGEATLDFEYTMPLVYPQEVTYYQNGDYWIGSSFNLFLDALDESYCTYDGGDDHAAYRGATAPDPSYPDVYAPASANPWLSNVTCGGLPTTKVISISYGPNEVNYSPSYLSRQCHEYMKLALQGTTVMSSSGDQGVAGNNWVCLANNTFNPTFPDTCPYVTSVGGTMMAPNSTIHDREVALNDILASGAQVITGGGFSNIFALPDFQKDAVLSWFKNHPPAYSFPTPFNSTQNSRAIPDVAVNGAKYLVAQEGEWRLVWGTSASTPVFASMITLINQARLDMGKSTVGWINPTLYAHPELFNDITQGSNPGCSSEGFNATEGWDPVSGLGTPIFPKLLETFLNLP